MSREPYERDGRIVIEDPYVSEFGTEEDFAVGACPECGWWFCQCERAGAMTSPDVRESPRRDE